MFTKTQLMTMLELQDSMNKKVNPDWIDAGNDWLLAASMEASEAIDHHGWKWWKKQEPDMDQLRMELVDIWHFILSYLIEGHNGDKDGCIKEIDFMQHTGAHATKSIGCAHDFRHSPLVQNLKVMQGQFAFSHLDLILFMHVLGQVGMSTDDLYKQYVGKNVLNFFRQDNGYKEGTYVKEWNGREDNEVLTEILDELDPEIKDFQGNLYQELQARYPTQ